MQVDSRSRGHPQKVKKKMLLEWDPPISHNPAVFSLLGNLGWVVWYFYLLYPFVINNWDVLKYTKQPKKKCRWGTGRHYPPIPNSACSPLPWGFNSAIKACQGGLRVAEVRCMEKEYLFGRTSGWWFFGIGDCPQFRGKATVWVIEPHPVGDDIFWNAQLYKAFCQIFGGP